jgi:hypothetical protein
MNKLAKTLAIVACGVFLASCDVSVEVTYDVPFEQMVAEARETGDDFCVVISRTDCPPCAMYVEMLTGSRGKKMFPDVRYNVVDVLLPENQWYTQWLCTGAFPTACLFSAEGKLKAIVPGTNRQSTECLRSAAEGDVKCADYLYDRFYQVRGNYLDVLNDLLVCKMDLDAGKDIGDAVDACLRRIDYPWAVWLKAVNAQRQGRTEEAADAGRRLLEFDETYYYYVYGDILTQAKYIIDPDYNPAGDAVLSIPEEDIILDGCKVDEPRRFGFEVKNMGKFSLLVRDIQLSCTCLTLLSPKMFRLEPGESSLVEAEFTAEARGEFYREVILFSNATESMQRVAVRAQVAR